MKTLSRLALAFVLLSILACPGFAQFTLVSGTVTDSNGLPWACGTISATLVNPNGVSATLNGQTIAGFTAPVKLGCPTDPTTSRTAGFFQMQLADNTLIKCGIATCATQTTWQFTANTTGIAPPQGTGPQAFTQIFTISGSTQTLTFVNVPALSNGGLGAADPAFVGTATPSIGGQTQIIPGNSITSNGNTGTSTFSLPALPFPVSQNHSILCLARWSGASTFTSITDTLLNTYTQVGTTKTTTSITSTAFNVAVALASNVAGGAADVITLTTSGAANNQGLECIETTPGTVDAQTSATGNGTALSSGNITTTNNQDTVFGLGFVNVACTVPGCTAGTNFGFVSGLTGVAAHFAESQVLNATSTLAATATATATADWAMFAVAMKGTPATPILSNSVGTGPFSLGTITSLLTPVQFKISGGQITAGQGQLTINVTSGSISNAGWALTASVDGGTSWFAVPCNVRTTYAVTGSDQTPIFSAQCSLVGLMGETGTNFRFGPTQGYGISNLVVWGAI